MAARVEINKKAIRRLLRGEEGRIVADLEARGRRIAAAAGPGHEVEIFVGRNRARVTVRTDTWEARHAEATRRSLTGAVDAGRGG